MVYEFATGMRRGYSAEKYRQIIQHIRERIPGVSIATDIIVGFPGETEEQFMVVKSGWKIFRKAVPDSSLLFPCTPNIPFSTQETTECKK